MTDSDDIFRPFVSRFTPDVDSAGPIPGWTEADTTRLAGRHVRNFSPFMRTIVRGSFERGLLRFFVPSDGPLSVWTWNTDAGWMRDWPKWRGRLRVFAYDWLGRMFGFDQERIENDEPLIGFLDPGAGEMLEIPCSFERFITQELLVHTDACLADQGHREWLAAGKPAPRADQCIGCRRPLFLGGKDDESNFELSDLSVYISLMGQLATSVEDLPVGAPISALKIR